MKGNGGKSPDYSNGVFFLNGDFENKCYIMVITNNMENTV